MRRLLARRLAIIDTWPYGASGTAPLLVLRRALKWQLALGWAATVAIVPLNPQLLRDVVTGSS